MVLSVLLLSCGDKDTSPAPPPVGWHAEEGWTAQCWYPPDFEAIEVTEGISGRRMKRQETLEALKSQWLGERDDGVSFHANVIEDVETTLLGRPDAIEVIGLKNLEFCKQVMGGGASTEAWNSWLRTVAMVPRSSLFRPAA